MCQCSRKKRSLWTSWPSSARPDQFLSPSAVGAVDCCAIKQSAKEGRYPMRHASLAMALLLGVWGCGKNEQSANKPSDKEKTNGETRVKKPFESIVIAPFVQNDELKKEFEGTGEDVLQEVVRGLARHADLKIIPPSVAREALQ